MIKDIMMDAAKVDAQAKRLPDDFFWEDAHVELLQEILNLLGMEEVVTKETARKVYTMLEAIFTDFNNTAPVGPEEDVLYDFLDMVQSPEFSRWWKTSDKKAEEPEELEKPEAEPEMDITDALMAL